MLANGWNNCDGGKKRRDFYYVINPEQSVEELSCSSTTISIRTDPRNQGEVQSLNTMAGWYRVNQSENFNAHACNKYWTRRLMFSLPMVIGR